MAGNGNDRQSGFLLRRYGTSYYTHTSDSIEFYRRSIGVFFAAGVLIGYSLAMPIQQTY